MRYTARIGIIASLVAIAACERPESVTAPLSNRGAPPDALADKQSTTGSRLLINIYDVGSTDADIGVVDDDGSDLVPLTNDGSLDFEPAWAPDGKRIVFWSNAFGANSNSYSLFTLNDDGTGLSRLTFAPADGSDRSPVGFAKGIVFSRIDPLTQLGTIFLLDADGGETPLTTGVADVYPAPSPKGKSVAFTRVDDIYVLDLVTRGVTNITKTPGCLESSAAYAPDGKRIAFRRDDCGNIPGGIFVMNEDGTDVTRLTANPPGWYHDTPRWSPDGKRIAFTRGSTLPGVVEYDIYVMNADGTDLRAVLMGDALHNYVVSAWARY